MTFLTKGNVRYYPCSDFYTVGDNSTETADGISSTSYAGKIVIEEKINGKDVLEISNYAFQSCT